jgi:hypothetical protein
LIYLAEGNSSAMYVETNLRPIRSLSSIAKRRILLNSKIIIGTNTKCDALIESLNYCGLWWLPSNDNLKVWGTLTFSRQEGAKLVLWDSLKEQDSREIKEAEIILGNAYDNKIITLYKCNCNSIRNDELGYRKPHYEIKYIFLGRHIKNPSDIKFRKIREGEL